MNEAPEPHLRVEVTSEKIEQSAPGVDLGQPVSIFGPTSPRDVVLANAGDQVPSVGIGDVFDEMPEGMLRQPGDNHL